MKIVALKFVVSAAFLAIHLKVCSSDHPRVRLNHEIFAYVSTFVPQNTVFEVQDVLASGACQNMSMSALGAQIGSVLMAGIMPKMNEMMSMGACFSSKTFTSPMALLPGATQGLTECLTSDYDKMMHACAKTQAKGNESFVTYLYRMHRIAYRKLGWGLMQRCITAVCKNIKKGYMATFAGCAPSAFLWTNHTLTC